MTIESQMYRQLLNTLGVNSQEEAMAEIGRLHGCSLRVEAAKARMAKLVERINERFESYYKQGPDHALDGEPLIYAAFLEELHETINAQGESNGD